jgi:glucose-6-phosphate 1-dehydrogenase
MHALKQERRHLAKKQKELSAEEARELKVPTFKHHFYYAAKDLLDQEDFKRIKDEARSRLDAELERRGFTA